MTDGKLFAGKYKTKEILGCDDTQEKHHIVTVTIKEYCNLVFYLYDVLILQRKIQHMRQLIAVKVLKSLFKSKI